MIQHNKYPIVYNIHNPINWFNSICVDKVQEILPAGIIIF